MRLAGQTIRVHLQVEGIVQGVGFRPFVYSLANSWQLSGMVGNNSVGAFVELEGTRAAVAGFQRDLRAQAPPLAVIDLVTVRRLTPTGEAGFRIAESRVERLGPARVAPDSATCADCLRELADPGDRRFGYPFLNCTNCGPRFTIVQDVPYDRPRTTMASFTMCGPCQGEYDDPGDRRFHAQPVCCAACGPRLRLTGFDGEPDAVVAAAAELLRQGRIVAVKGLGGYHLAADATSEEATQALRKRKHREEKAFAVMVADLEMAHTLAVIGPADEQLLTSPARPIVLLPRRGATASQGEGGAWASQGEGGAVGARGGGGAVGSRGEGGAVGSRGEGGAVGSRGGGGAVGSRGGGGAVGVWGEGGAVAGAVAPGQGELGLMLPYTPLHVLLMREFGRPLVLTSGNVSDEPIAYVDGEARQRLGGVADAFLTHDRPIHVRVDDSVVRSFRGEPMVIRRSRGYAPRAIRLPVAASRAVLGCGAELKNTFCLAQDGRATMSHHIGDLKNYETFRSFAEGIAHLGRLVGVSPLVVAHDLHPDYLSTRYAEDSGLDLVGVQHHHAHIASCLVDNQATGPVIGVAFDGTGYGADGTLWGGEFLVADLAEAQRAGHLAPVAMPGGEMAVKQPWRMAAAYCAQLDARPVVAQRHPREWDAVTALARSGFQAPPTSSAGRLFDAVACLLGVRDEVSYEGQAAVELEQLAGRVARWGYRAEVREEESERLADRLARGGYRAEVREEESERLADRLARGGYRAEVCECGVGPFQIRVADLVAAVLADLQRHVPAPAIAMRFHRGLALSIADGCDLVRDTSGLETVALSGGVFQNVLLLRLTVDELGRRGFSVLTHRRIPANDGGISIGQVAVAAARDALGVSRCAAADRR